MINSCTLIIAILIANIAESIKAGGWIVFLEDVQRMECTFFEKESNNPDTTKDFKKGDTFKVLSKTTWRSHIKIEAPDNKGKQRKYQFDDEEASRYLELIDAEDGTFSANPSIFIFGLSLLIVIVIV